MVRKGYVQLVNSFYMNRKVRKLRHTCPSAIGAFTMMLTFCGDNLSDGHISEDDAFYGWISPIQKSMRFAKSA